MSRKSNAIEIWKQMKPAAIARLALAVFLMFGTLGPLMILMQSSLETLPWSFVLVQTVACGGMAASLILFARTHWWVTLLIVALWSSVLVMNSGEFSVGYFANEGFRVHLGKIDRKNALQHSPGPVTLRPEQLDLMYTQKAQIGLCAIAMLAVGYVFFIRVIRAEVSQRARLETEIKITQEIQQSLLPLSNFQNSWCKISGMTLPASEVGGDFFDIVELPENQIAIAVADVAGHGVGSGILSAMTKSALRSQLLHDVSPAKVLENINRTIYQVAQRNMFVTFAYLLLDSRSGTAAYGTAGHPPIVFRGKVGQRILHLRTSNPALGLQRESQFTEECLPFSSGDSFLLYTDGIVEETNAKGEEFGIERMQELLIQRWQTKGSELCSGVIDSARLFSNSSVFKDDVTIVSVEL